MKNTQIKYKLNFKTMKKGLLTVLAASLVFVGCQNYDDQFDDLNAQISALKSQVDGLSSLSSQVASLSGTISGLQAGVNAAQASATAAAAAASAAETAANAVTTTPVTDVSSLATAAELATLSASLAALQVDVDAVQASLASTATAAAVTTLQAEIDAIEVDLDNLLATSNIYSSLVEVTSATSLNAALALGNKINVLNNGLTITGWSGMDYAGVQTLVDRINTMTGAITYTAYSSTGTAVVFNNLTSVGNITMTQPGSYSFPKLTNAAVIDLKDDYETTVTSISFPLLTTVTGLQTDATADTIIFTYATEVDFGSLATTPNAQLTVTTKLDATLDLGSWVAKDTAGTYVSYDLTLNGPASFTNGTAAGTFASTGLPAQTLGAHEGLISLTNVATATIHNYRGTITASTGVKNLTGTNVVAAGISGATDLETLNLTLIRDNNPALTAAQVTALGVSSASGQDHALVAGHAKLTSATITGLAGDISATSVPALTTLNLSGATAFDVSVTGNVSLTSFTDATTAEDWNFDNNDVMTSVVQAHTTSLTVTGDLAKTVSISGNAEITSATLSADKVDVLNITSNAKLATIAGGTNLTTVNADTSVDVDIHQNALVASLVRDTKESPSATVVVGASSDTGSITTASGIKDLDTYLASAKASTGIVSVWFDTVTKLEIQATYGGSYTDTTSSVTAPTSWTDANAATNAALVSSGTYAGVYAYMFSRDASTAVTSTTGARANEYRTWVYDVGRNAASYSDKNLATNEGFVVSYTGGSVTFKQGDSYSSAANGSTIVTVDDLVAYMNADTTLDGLGVDIQADRAAFERTLATMTFTQSTGGAKVAGTTSGTGRTAYTITNTETGVASLVYATNANNDGVAELVDDLILALNGDTIADTDLDVTAAAGTNDDQILLTRNISGGGVADNSPLAVNINIVPIIDAAEASTTIGLTGDNVKTYHALSETAGLASATALSNVLANTNGYFAWTVTEQALSGIRVTLKNTGNVLFADAVSVVNTGVSNTAILQPAITVATSANGAITTDGVNSALVEGTNAPTYANENSMQAYVTAFTAITAGTTTTTTAAVTAVDTDRTGW